MKRGKLFLLSSIFALAVTGCDLPFGLGYINLPWEKKDSQSSSETPSIQESDSTASETQSIIESNTQTQTNTISESVSESSSENPTHPMAKYARSLYMSGDSFKVLNLTDIQLHNGDSLDKFKHVVDTLVARENPDMIVILGDTINDSTSYDVNVMAPQVVSYIDSLDIPWAPIFGNHDCSNYHPANTKKSLGEKDLASLFTASKNCLYLQGPANVQGLSNYLVNILDPNDDSVVETLVFLDSKTNGIDSTNVSFYEDAIKYAKELNGGVTAPSVMFDHIPIYEYLLAKDYLESIECHNVVGVPSMTPLACGDSSMFNKIKELGSTKTVISGHDHDNSYYTEYDGIVLAYGMKSSEGDDLKGGTYAHPMGGLVLTIDGKKDDLRYEKITDVFYSVTSDFPYHTEVLPYWQYSAATLEFDVELPASGTIKFNLEGTNLLRTSVSIDKREGAWNRLTANVSINAATKKASIGTLTQVSGNIYHYSASVTDFTLNTGTGEVARGDETCRLVYFNGATSTFKIKDVHFTFEDVTETNQIDLANAVIETIADCPWNGIPARPEPVVKLNGNTLKKGDDFIYTYSNNLGLGQATMTIIPSGKGAHNYKGEKSVTFNIIANPDDDTLPGHEKAQTISSGTTLATNSKTDEFISVPNWYNCGKLLHIEVKRLEYGQERSGETVRLTFMGTNTNAGSGQCDPNGDWNRLTDYYYLDFANDSVVLYKKDKKTVVATGVALSDGWFSLEIDFKDLTLNSIENVHGNNQETLNRIEFSQSTRSFKIDNISLVSK